MAAAKSGYEDVFGGPPRSFAARVNDYAEIFGGPAAASACSIPVLDLPPAMDGFDSAASLGARSSGLDYSEVFGGFKGADFGVSYEELLSSSNGRTASETGYGQQAREVSEFKDRMPYLEKNQLSSNSFHSDDGTKQYSMSYHKTSRGSIDDVINGTAYVTHLHAVPGFTFSIDSSPPLQDVTSAYSPNMATNGFISKAGYNGNGEQVKVIPPSASCVSTKSCAVDLKEDQKQFINGCHASEDNALNTKHHSRSSSNHSISSVDLSFPDATYLTVSDISLQTQPSQMPPPSRPPPNLVSKQGHPKMKMHTNSRSEADEGRLSRPVIYHQTRYSKGASKVHAQEATKDGSPFFCDVEVDASSAAAASAAAMKIAMEQAEARLKSAKESMERKRVKFQSGKKVGLDGRKEDSSAHEGKVFSEVFTPKMPLKEDKVPKDSFFNMGEKTIRATKIAPNHGEKERYPVSAEEDQEIVQGSGFKSSQMHHNLEEISGEWKTEKQFYELINNKCKTANEVYEQGVVEKQPQATTRLSEEKENLTKEAKLTSEFGRNEKLSEVSTTGRMVEHDENLEAGSMVCKEELRESPETVLEACLWKENVNGVCEEKAKKPSGDEELLVCEKREASYEACKVEDIHVVEAEERNPEAAEAVSRCEDTEKEPKGTYEICEPRESEYKLRVVGETGAHDIIEDEMEVAVEAGNKIEEAEKVNLCETIKIMEEKSKQEYFHGESEFKSGSSSLTLEQEEARILNSKQETCTQMENDLEFEGAQDTTEWEETLLKFKATQGTMGHSDNRKKIEVKEPFNQGYTERKTTEAQPEVQLNEKTKKAVEEPRQTVSCEELSGAEGDYGKREDGKVEQIHIALDSEDILNKLNSATEICQEAIDNDLEDAQHPSLLEKQCNLVTSAQATMESHPTVVTNNTMHETEETEKERLVEREEEVEKERERILEEEEERERILEEGKQRDRILEEEKEREREREKDRAAVERATREAHQRALAEARERAERLAVERVTAEARQRALAEAREKAEKTAAEIIEKSLAEKASREARLRAERAAVERATAEARERAVERAIAEKDARERAARLNATSRNRTRKENEMEYRTSYKEDNEARLRSTSDVLYNGRSQTADSSASSQRYSDPYNHAGEGESALRCKARLERHQRTVERAAKALAEKNLRDVLAQREQAERDRLAESLDADVKRWSNGKEGNLRALLSTLQYILGAESGWQPIPLTDVITAVAVKKAYRKATLFVHPDKLQQRGASIQQKYICEKVFDLLKEAWDRFNSEER